MTGPTTRHSGKEYTRVIPFYIRHLRVRTNSCIRQSHNPVQRRSATGRPVKLIGILWIHTTYPQWTQLWHGNWNDQWSVHVSWSPYPGKRCWNNYQGRHINSLKLKTTKCEIIMDDFGTLDSFTIFKDFIGVSKDNMSLLGAPILQWPTLDEHSKSKQINYKSQLIT